ncbi:non-specific lipid-transfer protein 2-like [Dorcoceras hygrometricum]|uniref:Non-specific lipid-transfer protein 2-like n=1 Tax=Dorcoceras hygrometricum TaxID=472368 RepID=A0A2Z7C5J7_9LAMI|nr:non-specific lipid-transfer protein 2-like [Dorcoceras hygrometricum]
MNSKIACLAILVAFFLAEFDPLASAAAVTCNPLQLSPCAAAVTTSGNPSVTCCNKLKEQKPCLCQYMSNPNLQKFINSPGAKKVADFCDAPFPTC